MEWRSECLLAVLVGLGLAFLVPIGLASSEAADLAASACGLGRPLRESTPLAEVLARGVVWVPIGELGTRPHLIAIFCGAIAGALLLARLRLGDSATDGSFAPGLARGNPGRADRNGGHRAAGITTTSVALGVLMVVLSRPFLEIATIRPATAIDFVLFTATALGFEVIRRDPARPRVGLALAFLCGLAGGAGWSIRAVAWPVGSMLTVWALRRGERWPLHAPTVFVAGGGVALAGVVAATVDPPVTLGTWWRDMIAPDRSVDLSTVKSALALLTDDIGVLALLAVAIGGFTLIWRRPAETVFLMLLSLGTAATSLAAGEVSLARLILIVGSALPLARGHSILALPFGRARGAVSLVLGVVIVTWPAVVGIGSALAAPGRRVPGEVARRLDVAVGMPLPSGIGTLDNRDGARWRRYARLVGLDPTD